jgi:hypothetical protein
MGEERITWNKLVSCYDVHNKSGIDWSGIETGTSSQEDSD